MIKEKDIVCAVTFIDEAKVKYVKGQVPEDRVISHLADTFKNLGDFTRLKILLAFQKQNLCMRFICIDWRIGFSYFTSIAIVKNLRFEIPQRR
jgi:hypothetical protein